jgi:hypothetical protein
MLLSSSMLLNGLVGCLARWTNLQIVTRLLGLVGSACGDAATSGPEGFGAAKIMLAAQSVSLPF